VWERWGPLEERYRTPGSRRILALDGGGIRGILTLGVLERLESELRVALAAGDDFRLCDFFDLVGGTSTGAIIAAAIARGLSIQEIAGFYRQFGREAFRKRRLIERWQSLYGDGEVARLLKDTFGADTDLRPENLRCLLVAVTRNSTTDSAWPISSNPSARYNDPARADCNLRIPLWQLVRASTAAPVFFPPEVIRWDPNDDAKAFVFVDGGTTAYNNPAFLLFRLATTPAYRLNWATGERNLLIVSVGTGSGPIVGPEADDPETNALAAVSNTLSALMSQASVDQDVNCRVIGRCAFGGLIDRELGDLVPTDNAAPPQLLPLEVDTGKLFLYARYNAELTPEGLASLGITDIDANDVRKMDSVEHIDDLARIGKAVADKHFDLRHLGSFVAS